MAEQRSSKPNAAGSSPVAHSKIQARSFNRQNVGLQNRSSPFKSECACQFPIKSKEKKSLKSKEKKSLPHLSPFFLCGRYAKQVMAVVLKTIALLSLAGSSPAPSAKFTGAQLNGIRAVHYERTGWRFKSSRPLHFNFVSHFGVVQLAGRLTLNQETKVQILSPKPKIFTTFWAFRR